VTVEFINTTFAVNDANITWTNTPVSGDVMTNDYDLESDAQVFQSFLKQDGSGTPVVLDGNGEFVVSGTDLAGNPVANAGKIKPDGFGGYDYTPAAGFNGKVSVPYAMEDNNSAGVAKDTAYLQFTVSPPLNGANSVIAQNDEYFTFGDPVQFNLLQNDGDPQGDNFNVTKLTYLDNNGILQSTTSLPGSPLTVSGVDENGNVVVAGTVTLNAAGALVFTPNGGFKGKVTLNYEITDDNANPAKSNADVVLIVGTDNNGVNNDPPFAGDDFATTTINQPVSGNFFGNDDDPNGDAINMNDGNGNHITINPANPKTGIRTLTTVEGGTVEFFANGTFDYTPPTGYTGPDKVVYEICDVSSQSPGSMCSYATIYLGVGPDPCDYDPAGGGTPSDAWAGMDCDGDGVTNGQELTDGTDPKNPCSYNAAHQVYANTTAAWKAMDCDSDGMTNAEEITGVNDPSTPANPGGSTTDPKNPDTDGDGVTDGDERTSNGPGDPLTDANNPCSFNVAEQGTPGAAWNAADCDGDGVTNGDEITSGGSGDPVTNPLDPCSYNKAEQVFANTTAAWKALDCDGDGNPNGGDPDPKVATARDDAFTAPFGGPTSYNILANDDFLANDGNTITKVGGTAGGTVAFNPVTGDMTYTPLAGEVNSTLTVVYEVCQGAVCDQATVTITVPAAGDSDGDGDPDNTDPEPNNPCVWGSTHTPTVANTSAAWKAGDCDGDGVTNGNEIASSGPGDPATNPLDPCNYNVAEQVIANTSAAWKAMDCDNDGLDNGEETTGLDNPLTPANPGGSTTDPKNPDTDGDGVTDGDERTSNGPGDPLTDANNPCSFNVAEQGTPGAAWNAADCDGDGVTNGDEITSGGSGDPVTNPLDPCSYNKAEQVFANTTAAWKALDCDGDGNPNGGDPDPKVATARDDAFTAPYGAPTSYNILANDDFLANDGNTITKVGGTAGGTVTFNPVTGNMTYAPLFSEIGNTVTVVYEVCQGVVCDQATATINVTDVALQLNLKALLQGAYSTGTGLMRDDLRVKSLIPLTQPYGDAAYSDLAYSGTETTTNTVLSVAGADAIVDWVLVELRDRNNPATVISRQAALIQRDGDIVAVDGVSSLSFNLPFDSYYIAVKHRNHLGVMTKTPYALSSTPVLVDFTSTSVDNYKLSGVTASDYAQKVASNGKRLLWASNVQKEGNVYRVIYQGPNNEVTPVFIDILTDPLNVGLNANFIKNGYLRSDVTMDGRTIYQGPSNEVDVIYFEVITHPENTSIGANFIINQQIP
ncbi:MAG TPA: Ig-like domain-containing protein, partial [Saprospiraceae bacterium]|nr:Ig-like domain-containing protein [Saprospiraceae bacterium]